MEKKRKRPTTETAEARRRERERYDERTRLLEERIARGIERIQRRRDAS
jgi:YD repeat-containing protein